MRHACPHHGRGSRRHEQRQALDHGPPAVLAQVFQPQQPESERCVHRRLELLRIHPEHRRPRIALAHDAARVHRAERAFQVGGGGERVELVRGKLALDQPRQQGTVVDACRLLRRRRAPVAAAANLQFRGAGLAEAQDAQVQRVLGSLHLEHPPHHIALPRPQVQQALPVLFGERVSRLAQIEHHRAVFQHDRIGRAGEVFFQLAR